MADDLEMICILGATATGKTKTAVALARLTNGSIISADSRQVFRGMDIGTGKDLADYGSGSLAIPYHLIDVADAGQEFNLFEYQRMFLDSYNAVRCGGRFPILCGGTGLYIDAILNCYNLVEVGQDADLRAELEKLSDDELVARLASYRALHNTTDTMDRDRLVRAIEIAAHSNDDCSVVFPKISARVFGLQLEREELKKRITARLKERLADGMVEEVEGLLDKGISAEQLDFYGLEYRYLARFISGELNRNDMFQKLNAAIYQFARRQEKWFRRMERKGTCIRWLSSDMGFDALAKVIYEESGFKSFCFRP